MSVIAVRKEWKSKMSFNIKMPQTKENFRVCFSGIEYAVQRKITCIETTGWFWKKEKTTTSWELLDKRGYTYDSYTSVACYPTLEAAENAISLFLKEHGWEPVKA